MEKNDIFTFTAPSGVEVTAVVVDEFICYEITQNVNQSYNFAIDYGFNDCGEGEVKLDD